MHQEGNTIYFETDQESYLMGVTLPREEQNLHMQPEPHLNLVLNRDGGLYYLRDDDGTKRYVLYTPQSNRFVVEMVDGCVYANYDQQLDRFQVQDPLGGVRVSFNDELYPDDDDDYPLITDSLDQEVIIQFQEGDIQWDSGLVLEQKTERYVVYDWNDRPMYTKIHYTKSGRVFEPTYDYLEEVTQQEHHIHNQVQQQPLRQNRIEQPRLHVEDKVEVTRMMSTMIALAGIIVAIMVLMTALNGIGLSPQNIMDDISIARNTSVQPTATLNAPMVATPFPPPATIPANNAKYTSQTNLQGIMELSQRVSEHLNSTYGYTIPWEVTWALLQNETSGRCAPSHDEFHRDRSGTLGTLGSADTYGSVNIYRDSCTGDPNQIAMAQDANRLAGQIRGVSQFSTGLAESLVTGTMYSDININTATMFRTCTEALGITDRTGRTESDISTSGSKLISPHLQSQVSRGIVGDSICLAAINAAVIAGRGHASGNLLGPSGWYNPDGTFNRSVIKTVGDRYHGACNYTYQTDQGPVFVPYCGQIAGLTAFAQQNYGTTP